MSRIFLVQSGDSLDGGDGYSYGLVQGGHPWLLISFVDFLTSGRTTIHKKPIDQVDRRPLSKRALEDLKGVDS